MKKILSLVAVVVLALSTITVPVSAETQTDNSEAEVQFNGGALTLDSVSSIAFGSHDIERGEGVYHSETLDPSLQVTDLRGTGAGWKVTAEMTGFTDDEGDTSLMGSTIDITNGSVDSDSMSPAPEPASSIHLEPNLVADVITAPVDTGRGEWVTSWQPSGEGEDGENNNIVLTVPEGSATAGNHTATITWTLNDTP